MPSNLISARFLLHLCAFQFCLIDRSMMRRACRIHPGITALALGWLDKRPPTNTLKAHVSLPSPSTSCTPSRHPPPYFSRIFRHLTNMNLFQLVASLAVTALTAASYLPVGKNVGGGGVETPARRDRHAVSSKLFPSKLPRWCGGHPVHRQHSNAHLGNVHSTCPAELHRYLST
jgi:hypothetical protein